MPVTMHKLVKALPLAGLLPGIVLSLPVYDTEELKMDIFGEMEFTYGNRDAYYEYHQDHNGSLMTMELGFALRAKLNEYVDAIAMDLTEMNAETEDETQAKYLFAGIDAKGYGQLVFGRGDSAFYSVVGTSDIYEFIKSRSHEYYNALGEQRNGLIMYSLSAMGNDLRLSWQSNKDNSDEGLLSPDYGISASMSNRLLGNVTLAYGVEYYQYNYETPRMALTNWNYFRRFAFYEYMDGRYIPVTESLTYGGSLTYGILNDGFYASFIYTTTDYDNLKHHLESFDLITSYTFENGFGFSAGYQTQRYDHINIIADLNLGIFWQVSPNFKVFLESLIDVGNNDNYRMFYANNRKYKDDQYIVGTEFAF